jgi:hypothetical protein
VCGVLREAELIAIAAEREPVELHARKGDAILMCPLLIHSSRPAAHPAHRRVLHIEFAMISA